jgi:micrococcal nuclease
VVSVTDGDTLRVRLDPGGEVETVRLIGIDAPEADECFGAVATAELERLVGSGVVGLTIDVSDRDRFGRLLRHVWTDAGRLAGEELVRSGHAIARVFPPDTGEAARLAVAQDDAEAAGRGLWGPDACGAATGSAVVIAHIEYDAPGDDSLNLNAEWIDIRNGGADAAHLTGWMVKDESASHRFAFPAGFVLDPDATVRIRTGCGEDIDLELHWCNEASAIWNNSGDTGFLLDPNGNIVDTLRY